MKESEKNQGPALGDGAAKKAFVLFDTRPVVGDYQLNPITGGRLAVLDERANPIMREPAPGEDEIEVKNWDVFEVMFVAVKTDSELAEYSLLDDREWSIAIREFAMPIKDDVLLAFWAVCQGELKAITEAVPKKKTAKKKGMKK